MRMSHMVLVLPLLAGAALMGCQSLEEARYPGSIESSLNNGPGIADNSETNGTSPTEHPTLEYSGSAANSVPDSNNVNGSDKPPANMMRQHAMDR